jgi:hypothetical protein
MAKNIRADESVLHPATSKSGSLRTTIPAYIVSQLELKKGDKFRWYMQDEFLAIEVIHQEKTD